MAKAIIDYQKAFKEITNVLTKNENILSIFVFGSMVSGDLWEESDIDLFVLCKDEFDKVRDVYLESLSIPIHIKFLSKESFINIYNESSQKRVLKDTLLSSKLIYSKDKDIDVIYTDIKYLTFKDKEIWNLVYLGKLLKDIGICKKYLHTGGLYTCYEILIRVFDSYSKLYLNMNGLVVSKDSLTMACNLNDSFNEKVKDVLFKEFDINHINEALKYIETYVDLNLKVAAKVLIEFLENENRALSSYEIKNSTIFKNFDIKIENILKKLYKNNMVSKDVRDFKDPFENLLTEENVYSYKEF
ncbi:nucleotidyltransferase domain-containing protein [Clostridium septicum]|uniref:Nucleotidyltransferase domain-containing protein n=1 Tax=Clostridium septicum TaxID=1504 RepID=A0A9N7JPI1_CLOSE|nr:nucleotidyltransferase domain-containing protein [Clostridium septicum]AYE35452.1 nucleotidyltransferase domain-containing protein [Clostridium septicum]MDU1314107.1 nucleotidyltransferase domain-containing protein [Clostridium septicum]QAS60840.1 nucleotidyltransferase domain-containing protein [Clostridium septicum]UEC19892.1 nucleotidyltransferase domain-containing protein [Clostridium septicum]USS02048.1 nucleotidyltransferase domain-containing protein [Clostridium septicum]